MANLSLTDIVANSDLTSAAINAIFAEIESALNGTTTIDIDIKTGNFQTGGKVVLDVDGTATNAVGAITLGASSDAGIYFDGSNLIIESVVGGGINIVPFAGSDVLIDGTISIDAGVIIGATSITSTVFLGNLTGNVTGNVSGTAATVTGAAQGNITSLGTLTTLTVDNININGSTITGLTDANTVLTAYAGKAIAIEGVEFYGGSVTGVGTLSASTGIFGNTSTAEGTLRVHTDTAGVVVPSTNADDLVVENSSNGGITILVPDASTGSLYFGSPSDNSGAEATWKYSTAIMTLGTSHAGGVVKLYTGNFAETATFSTTGLAMNSLPISGVSGLGCGNITSTGYGSFAQAVVARGGVTPTTGAGPELLVTGGSAYLQSYDRTGSAYYPLRIVGNDVGIYDGLSLIGTFSSTGLAMNSLPISGVTTLGLSSTGPTITMKDTNSSRSSMVGSIVAVDQNDAAAFTIGLTGDGHFRIQSDQTARDVIIRNNSIDALTIDENATATFAGAISVDDTTDSTSGTTGSIHTDGGLGVAKAAYIGTSLQAIGGAFIVRSITVAQDDVYVLGDNDITYGQLFATNFTSGTCGQFGIASNTADPVEISDPYNDFTITKDNASTTNIYRDAANANKLTLQNKEAGSRVYNLLYIGI